jgi:hypothetical protein
MSSTPQIKVAKVPISKNDMGKLMMATFFGVELYSFLNKYEKVINLPPKNIHDFKSRFHGSLTAK